jgi:hypothetical protein
MKATESGTVLGVAMEDFVDDADDIVDGRGTVMTFVTVRDVVLDDIKTNIKGLNQREQMVQDGFADERPDSSVETVLEERFATDDIPEMSKDTTTNAFVEAVKNTASKLVHIAQSIVFAGKVVFEEVVSFAKKVTFSDAVIFEDTVVLAGDVAFANDDMAGEVILPAGENRIDITFENTYFKKPIVTATVQESFEPYMISGLDRAGFSIVTQTPVDNDTVFSWMAFMHVSDARSIRVPPKEDEVIVETDEGAIIQESKDTSDIEVEEADIIEEVEEIIEVEEAEIEAEDTTQTDDDTIGEEAGTDQEEDETQDLEDEVSPDEQEDSEDTQEQNQEASSPENEDAQDT